MKIRSYDVFDTCLVRSCGSPEEIFHILAFEVLGKEAEKSDLTDFSLIRSNAEKRAKKILSKSEVTLEEIYDSCDFSFLTDINKKDILQKELEVEFRTLVGVSYLREQISREREEGHQIIYISDMYLPSSFIKSVLIKEGFWNETDKLFVSCEYEKSKRNGELYKEIVKILDENITTWKHHGDNIESDIRMPKKLGIKAEGIVHSYSYYQNNLLDALNRYNGEISGQVAGISRAVICKAGNSSEKILATDVIAPTLIPFVYNVLSEARKRSIKSLFFLARDGQILYDIALGFKDIFPEVSLHYLCVSRKTIYFPSLKSVDDIADIIDIKKTINKPPLEVIYNYTGVKIETSDEFKSKGLYEILKMPKVRLALENARAEQKDLILNYFIQEGLATKNDELKAIVDLRGSAKSLTLINTLLREADYDSVYGFYFEVTKNRVSLKKHIEYYSELFVENFINSDCNLCDLYTVLESYFCASSHGRTIGYSYKDSRIVPIFEEESNQQYITEVYNVNRQIIELWQKHYINNYIFLFNQKTLELGLSNLKSFAINPSSKYLSPLTNIYFSSTGMERESIVRKLSLKEIITMRLKNNTLSWGTGCLVWTFGKNWKYLPPIGKIAKRFMRKVLNIKLLHNIVKC